MKQPIRYFSLGLFTASLIVLIAFYFIGPKETTNSDSIEEMISSIEADGYHVITQSEYITLSVANETNEDSAANDDQEPEKEDAKETSNKEETKEDKKEDLKGETEDKEGEKEKIETYTLVIEENMVPSTVSQLLVDNKIIDDASEFNQFMEEKGYSPLIQIGKHKVSSDMSKEELAEELMKFN